MFNAINFRENIEIAKTKLIYNAKLIYIYISGIIYTVCVINRNKIYVDKV